MARVLSGRNSATHPRSVTEVNTPLTLLCFVFEPHGLSQWWGEKNPKGKRTAGHTSVAESTKTRVWFGPVQQLLDPRAPSTPTKREGLTPRLGQGLLNCPKAQCPATPPAPSSRFDHSVQCNAGHHISLGKGHALYGVAWF